MNEIEDRLRAELPELADRLAPATAAASTKTTENSDAPATGTLSLSDPVPIRRRFVSIAAAVAVIAAVAVGLVLSRNDAPAVLATGSPPAAVASTTTTSLPPTTSGVVFQYVAAQEFGIGFKIPLAWTGGAGGQGSRTWEGDDGWVQVSAANAMDGLAGVVDNLVNHHLKPFGSAPTVTEIVVDGADGRLIVPSGDAPAPRGFPEAAIAIELPPDMIISAGNSGVLTVSADADHIGAIADSIRFLEPPPVSKPTIAEPKVLATTPDGRFTYLAQYPFENELNGSLMVDDGLAVRPALRDKRDEFDRLGSIVFGPGGLVTWQSGDENYGAKAFLGRIDDGGQIIDSHEVTGTEEIIGAGVFDESGVLTIPTRGGRDVVIDPATDPPFVMSAADPPVIETETPLAPVLETEGYWAIDETASWYRGQTLGADPACGSSTLYKDDADGYARVLDGSIELDTVVDVDVSQTLPSGGFDTVGAVRAVFISSECAAEYSGRRVSWGLEFVDYGDGGPRFERPLVVKPLDIGPVAQIDAVTPILAEIGGCCERIVQVSVRLTLLDGQQQTLTVDVG